MGSPAPVQEEAMPRERAMVVCRDEAIRKRLRAELEEGGGRSVVFDGSIEGAASLL